jgi:hypothetical protein
MNLNFDSLFDVTNDERELESTQQEEKNKTFIDVNSKEKNSSEENLEKENIVRLNAKDAVHEIEEEISIITKLKILNKFVKCHVYEAEKHEEFMT